MKVREQNSRKVRCTPFESSWDAVAPPGGTASLPKPFLKSHYAFIEIIITNIASDRINFLGSGFTVQNGLNVAYFPTPTPTATSAPTPQPPQCLATSLRDIKQAWKVEQEIEKRGSCCVAESTLPAAASSAHGASAQDALLQIHIGPFSNNPDGPCGGHSAQGTWRSIKLWRRVAASGGEPKPGCLEILHGRWHDGGMERTTGNPLSVAQPLVRVVESGSCF